MNLYIYIPPSYLQNDLPSARVVNLNCMTLKDPNGFYAALLSEIMNKKIVAAPNVCLEEIEELITYSSNRKNML